MRRSASIAIVALLAGCTATQPAASPAPSAPVIAPPQAGYPAGKSAPVADPVYPGFGNPAIDVLHYGLSLAWAPETGTLSGTATVTMRAVSEQPQIRLDFSSAYRIENVTVDGAVHSGTVDGTKLTVPSSLTAGKQTVLVVKYAGKPQPVTMPSHRPDGGTLGLHPVPGGALWTMQEPYGAFTWYPVNDQPSDKALYDITISVPEGWSAVASGTPVPGKGFTYHSADPVASYLTTLAVGKYQHEVVAGPRGLPVHLWTRAKDGHHLPGLRRSPALLTWLEERLGPYPFPTAGVVLVDGTSGMETQQMVTLSGGISQAQLEPVLLHEYAHHWFGNTVTPSTWKDVWLNEGWATYTQWLYQGGLSERIKEARAQDGALRAQAGPPGNPNPGNFAERNVYYCTALLLHEIHQALGDEKFFGLAKAWVQEHRNSVQDRAAFTAFVNRHTGRDFKPLIDKWLDSPTTP
ncbi:M1 family metallopeptidase [Longispora albida]|uniref:M1 family metallopeptidase n=1 Tax=Longispora albida TaxID=203523 RepID=UPI000477CE81|nr:M1 family metallopeptidase [Longispora albida]